MITPALLAMVSDAFFVIKIVRSVWSQARVCMLMCTCVSVCVCCQTKVRLSRDYVCVRVCVCLTRAFGPGCLRLWRPWPGCTNVSS